MKPEDKKDLEIQGTPGGLMSQHDPLKDEEPFVLLEGHEELKKAMTGPPTVIQNNENIRVSVVLGNQQLTLVATEKGPDGIRFLESSNAEIGGKTTAALTLALREATRKMSRRPRSVEIVLPSSLCEYQVVSMPPMGVSEQTSYLDQLAFKSLGNQEACFAIIPLSTTALSTEALLISCPRDTVESIALAAHQAALVPECAMPSFLPALSLLVMEMQNNQDPVALVDQLANDEVNLLVWDEGKIRVHRNIRQSEGSDRWEEFLDSEVYRTVAFYRTQSGGKRVNKIYLATAGEAASGMKQRFEAVGMFEGGVGQLGVTGADASIDPLIPLGAAATTISHSPVPKIDLLPSELRHPRRKQILTTLAISLALIAGLGELFIYHGLYRGNQRRREVLQTANVLNAALSQYEKDYRKAEERKESYKKHVQDFDGLARQRVSFSTALAATLSVKSEQVYLKSLAVQANGKNGAFEVILNGTVDNRYFKDKKLDIDEYMDSLRSIPGTRSVDRIIKKTGAPIQGTTQREEFEIHIIFPAEVEKL